eukprot:SM000029S10555  [mRNA]  locus=s29:952187:953016:+ [translate_table: standard]
MIWAAGGLGQQSAMSPDGQAQGYIFAAANPSNQTSGHPFMPMPLQFPRGHAAEGMPELPNRLREEGGAFVFPERPGQPECQYYLRTGDCKYGATCRFHHPSDRALPSPTCVLSPIGLPLREGTLRRVGGPADSKRTHVPLPTQGSPTCTFYSRFGICKYGPTCRYDHPMHISPAPGPPVAPPTATVMGVHSFQQASPGSQCDPSMPSAEGHIHSVRVSSGT